MNGHYTDGSCTLGMRSLLLLLKDAILQFTDSRDSQTWTLLSQGLARTKAIEVTHASLRRILQFKCLFTMDSETEILSTESVSLTVIPTRTIIWSYLNSIVYGTDSMRSKNRKPFVYPCRSSEITPYLTNTSKTFLPTPQIPSVFPRDCPVVPRWHRTTLTQLWPAVKHLLYAPPAICSLYVLRDVQCMSVQSARN